MVPLAKGTEVLISYLSMLESRANRQKELETGGFSNVCRCEVCTLPARLSNALDTKIKAAIEAYDYLLQMFGGKHKDYVGGARCLETLITTITEERMFTVHHLMTPIFFFTFFRNRRLSKEVGQNLMPIFERYWGSDERLSNQPAITLPRYLEDPSTIPVWQDAVRLRVPIFKSGQEFHARLERVASTIITSLKRLPF
jgi:hypothetical protein